MKRTGKFYLRANKIDDEKTPFLIPHKYIHCGCDSKWNLDWGKIHPIWERINVAIVIKNNNITECKTMPLRFLARSQGTTETYLG